MKYVKVIGKTGHLTCYDYYLAEILRYDKSRGRYYCSVLPEFRSIVSKDCWLFDIGQFELQTTQYELVSDKQMTIFDIEKDSDLC